MNYLTDQAGKALHPGYPLPVATIVGIATGGSRTTLVDSTKAWITNGLVGATVYIMSGGIQYPAVVTSNTATTLTFASITPTIAEGDFYFIIPVYTVQLSGSYLVQDAIIAKDGTESTEVDLQKWKYISFLMPAGWDAATLTIKGSAVTGGTKRTIKNDVGQTFPAMTVAVDTIYTIDANALMLAGVHFIAFVASAAQTTAARTIKVMCKA